MMISCETYEHLSLVLIAGGFSVGVALGAVCAVWICLIKLEVVG